MIRQRNLVAGVAALALSVTITSCDYSKDLVNPKPPVNALFASYVSLGNSITAGYQSGGINDSTQQQAYPVLLAKQMGTPFTIPRLAMPGCPPPVNNFLTQARVNNPPPAVNTPAPCSFRADVRGDAVINNVGVPGAFVSDLTDPKGAAANNTLTTLILGGKTQVQRALDAHPTFASVWIGNNDALFAALSGLLTLTKDASGKVLSPGLTDTLAFKQSYTAITSQLTAGGTLKAGVLLGVMNASGAPLMFPARWLSDSATIKGAFDQAAGQATTIHPSCLPPTTSLISFQLAGAIKAGTHPPLIVCEKGQTGIPAPVGDVYVLDAAEQATLAKVVGGYNRVIQGVATQLDWVYIDPNPALGQLITQGQIRPFPNLAQPTKPFGDYISLDGIHPAAAAHRMVTDMMIDAINAKYRTAIPKLQ